MGRDDVIRLTLTYQNLLFIFIKAVTQRKPTK